jgi:insulysin
VAEDPECPLPPSLITEAPGMLIYHKLDRKFRVPKVAFFAHLLTRHVHGSPVSVIMHRLYSMVLRDALNEFLYDASVAGLSYSVSSRTTGLNVKVSGYSHKVSVLLERVMAKVMALLQEYREKGDADPEVRD